MSRETKKGWRLKACIGPHDYKLTGLLLGSPKEVEKLLRGNIVFVCLWKGQRRYDNKKT